MKSKYRKLESLYNKIPKIKCEGHCFESCTIVPAAKIEIKRVRDIKISNLFNPMKLVREMKINPSDPKLPYCNALKDKKCSIYRTRPAICRLYGVAQGLECGFGCKPDKYMTKEEAHALIREIEAL